LSSDAANPEPCQVDFYLLHDGSLQAVHFACRLAMMMWEHRQRTYIMAATESAVRQLDEQMWQHPPQRFLPHATADDPNAVKAPVIIGTLASLSPTDVVINLCPDAVPQTEQYKRILEIVPFADDERQASRLKYKIYRNLGLEPQTHEISK